ncbi:YceD family protein [Thermosediminibacter litoriperuensis]|uniref:DUF177 domain-containing protein n=1 Tax=Thermosediminibacter litoriperuensis TaxID=291989 RepID=A0A5S5AZ40_9FIRM|nr:DUF177 domain-containing protein [Thermosediminibacter litoriperuensis]TYP59977.1 uncharacterized protein LZ11_00139 [Thermosediminibacter litoriperuensis]
MELSIADIKQKVGAAYDFDVEEKVEGLEFKGERIDFVAPVRVNGRVENLGKKLFGVTGVIHAVIEDQCYRCLTKTRVDLKIDFNFKFSESPEKHKDEEDEVFPIEEDVIKLDTPVINEIILNLPSKVLCSPDCRGFCPYCGVDLNSGECRCKGTKVDPRLRVLEKLLDTNND